MRDGGDGFGDGWVGLGGRLSLVMISPMSGIAQSGLTPILPKISEHFAGEPYAEVLVRLMVTGLSAAMIVGALGAGMAAVRYGARRLLLWALLLFSGAGAAGYVLDDLHLMVVSRLLLGVATGMIGVLCATLITTRLAPALRARWLGFYVVAGTFGAVLLFPLIGIVGGHAWRGVFLFHLLALPVLGGIAALIPKDRTPEGDVTSARVAGGALPVGLILLGLCCGVVTTTSAAFLPFHMRSAGFGSPGQVAALMMTMALTGGVLSFAYGWLRARYGVIAIFVAGFFLNGAGMLVAVLSHGYAGAIAGFAIFGCGIGLIMPNVFAASAEVARPEQRARTIGLVRAGFYGGPLLAQVPLEPLSRAQGPAAALIALGLFALAMTVGVQFTRRSLVPAAA